MELTEIRRRLMMGMANSLNFREITIPAGGYTISEFWYACQAAVGENIDRWVVISDYQKLDTDQDGFSTFIFANGSLSGASTSVFINTGGSTYGGIQRVNGKTNTSTVKRQITSDMRFFAYVWGE